MAALDDLVTNLKSGVKYLGLIVQAINTKFPNWQEAPASATSPGVAGQVAYDSTHIYVCIAPNTWVRGTLSTF